MKSLTNKLLAFSFALIFAAGCATVTDANIDLPETEETVTSTNAPDGSFWDNRAGDSMDPIIDRPKTGGGMLD
ncbi:hypothetical protein DYD21_15820 [Rhodohalobacter sp. SW132]|uniref:hypothetical protein n=1 Tax=Rhodohalobacter sp. SW132 TaxID=2293433 RepID=UPI000E247524|nr:hypothetical protein [Rhodohalobacter sp. SW132]REL24985.1 hypothetical protein DYD21_15810 [Rhodohalobacter sp. SW132]REL24986.1 hypothetical protein DYD21_15815 [Rhodohalobacter sp. SW132]REL24987.1 hypothetical protein DYD21_15820 [Rhodohalobacter sp. SW132]